MTSGSHDFLALSLLADATAEAAAQEGQRVRAAEADAVRRERQLAASASRERIIENSVHVATAVIAIVGGAVAGLVVAVPVGFVLGIVAAIISMSDQLWGKVLVGIFIVCPIIGAFMSYRTFASS